MPLDYRALHWGEGGERGDERLSVAAPREGDAMTDLGAMRAIVYRTRKSSDGELTDYEHKFSRPHPRIVRHEPSGRLLIVGGRYRIEDRGIVDNAARADHAFAAVGPRARLVLLGDLVEVVIDGRRRTLRAPLPRLCVHSQTGLLVVAGGRRRPL